MSGTLTVVLQDSWPPRHQITASGLSDDTFNLYRVVGSARTLIRGAGEVYVYPETVFLVIDAELPFDVPFSYELQTADGTVQDTDGPHTVSLPGGNVALTDAITGLSAEVMIGAIDDLDRTATAAVYAVDGRNHVITAPLNQPQTVIECFTATLTARDNLRSLIAGATAGIIQCRGPSADYDVDAYYAVLATRERRFSADGSDPRRVTALTVAEVDGWPTDVEATGYTYADLAAVYTGLTYADLAADFATYLALAQGDFG